MKTVVCVGTSTLAKDYAVLEDGGFVEVAERTHTLTAMVAAAPVTVEIVEVSLTLAGAE